MNRKLYVWLDKTTLKPGIIPCYTGNVGFKIENEEKTNYYGQSFLLNIHGESMKDIENTVQLLIDKFEQFGKYSSEKINEYEEIIESIKNRKITFLSVISSTEAKKIVDIQQYLTNLEFYKIFQKDILVSLTAVNGVYPIYNRPDPITTLNDEINKIKQNRLVIETYVKHTEINLKRIESVQKYVMLIFGLEVGILLRKIF